jgi:hypothetical protein
MEEVIQPTVREETEPIVDTNNFFEEDEENEEINKILINNNDVLVDNNLLPENPVKEIDEILNKEELKPETVIRYVRKKRYRNRKPDFVYNLSQYNLHSLRKHKKKQYFEDTIKNILLENNNNIGMVVHHGWYFFIYVNEYNNFVLTSSIAIDNENNIKFPRQYKHLRHLSNSDISRYFPSYLDHYYSENYLYSSDQSVLIFDFKKFFNSKGKEFIIKFKSEFSYRNILNLKHFLINSLIRNIDKREILRNYTGNIYDEIEYDILSVYSILVNGFEEFIINFWIILKETNIIISNSIEQQKNIGDFYIYLHAECNNYEFNIVSSLNGIKVNYSITELINRYTHSHLPSESNERFSNFCLGTSNLFAGISKINEIDFQGLLFGIKDYLRWESLEGGPYKKIEHLSLLKPVDIEETIIFDSIYSKDELKYLITAILNHLDVFKSIFKLKCINGKYKFQYNIYELFDVIAEIYQEDKDLQEIINSQIYFYNRSTKKIFTSSYKFKDWDNFVNEYKNLLINRLPAYFKGEIIYPVLRNNNDQEERNELKNYMIIPNFYELIKIANAFNEMLNKELTKDEYTNRN